MPNNFDDNSLDNMSVEDINELFEDDVIEMPDEYKFLAAVPNHRGPQRYFERGNAFHEC